MSARVIRACLITNPKAGRGGVDLSQAYTVLQAHGWQVTVRRKLHGGHATQLAREAVRAGYNVIVDCGGDGTLNEIVEGVVGTDAAVGILPGGTANLWAHEMGISRQLDVAALQLIGAERRRVDVGTVSVNFKHRAHFMLLAGLGFDAAVLQHLSKPLKNRIGKLAYVPATLRALPAFEAVPLRATLDDIHWQGRVSQLFVGNTRDFAGFTRSTPKAYVDDGLLDVCLVTAARPIGIARQLSAMMWAKRPSWATAQTYRAAHVTLYSPVVMPLEVDGGTIKVNPDELTPDGVVYQFSVVAQGVCVLVPRTYSGSLFQPSRLSDSLTHSHLRPVTPVTVSSNGHSNVQAQSQTNGRQNGKVKVKVKSWQLDVLAVGVDSLTGARVKNGRIVRVIVHEQTMLEDGDGRKRPLWGTLSSVKEGHRVTVEGHKGDEPGVLSAHRVAVHHEPALASSKPLKPSKSSKSSKSPKPAKARKRQRS